MEKGCSKKASTNYFTIDEKKEFMLTAGQNYETGYSATMCIKCHNGYTSDTFDNIKVT